MSEETHISCGFMSGAALEQGTSSRLPGHPPKRLLAPSPVDLGAIQELGGLYQAIRLTSALVRFLLELPHGLSVLRMLKAATERPAPIPNLLDAAVVVDVDVAQIWPGAVARSQEGFFPECPENSIHSSQNLLRN